MINSNFLRYGKFLKYPRKIFKHLLSFLYPIFVLLYKLPKVKSVEETLLDIETNKNASIVRFGDGEILYLTDQLNLPFQKYETELAATFQEILKNNIPNLYVGMPIGYHSLKTMDNEGQIFWRSQIVWNYPRLKKYLQLNSIYANASITRIYYGFKKSYAEQNFNHWKRILTANEVIIIEGEKTRFGVGNDLLIGIDNIKRILGPKHNAFDKVNELIEFIETQKKPDLILVALGPAAKYIVFHLHQKGYSVIDVGNLDIEYEWYLRNVSERITIPGKYVSEVVGGREVGDIVDEKLNEIYQQQILVDLS